MPQHQHAVTGWWRRISLRAKVTGVTVAVLALGLLVAGVGTVPLLRTTLIGNIDAQLPGMVTTDLAARFFDFETDDQGLLALTPRQAGVRPTDYALAIYNAEGTQIGVAGPTTARTPVFPESFDLQQANAAADQVLVLETAEGERFHAAVTVKEATGVFYVQMVALPLSDIDAFIAAFLGIYTAVALATILVAALLIRVLVTLTFRRLGHVEEAAMAIARGDFSQRLQDLEPSTEVGRLNAAINTMLDRLDRALAERESTVAQMRRFIGDASHELRTPLVSVRGYAELYRMGAIRGDDDTARAMERIEKEAIRMGAMVEDLLALTRLDEQREWKIVPIDLRPLAHDAALDVRVAAPERTVTVIDRTALLPDDANAHPDDALQTPDDALSTLDDAPTTPQDARQHPDTALPTGRSINRGLTSLVRGWRRRLDATAPIQLPRIDFRQSQDVAVTTPPLIRGEENRVRQVIANLLGNAQRFSPADSPIEIIVDVDRARRVGSIAIVDHGEGIPRQIREQIFQRFWRADTSRGRETGGSGLGLAIVASIVQRLQGSVRVEETPGGGATFVVAFPLVDPAAIPEYLLQDTQPISPIDAQLL